MNAASKFISQQFPAVHGMQNTHLSQTGGFVPIMDNSVQIHFVNENHWVVSSFLDGVISLYNNLSCIYHSQC
ncbi:hypothetical protein EMCRGX_G017686 [Ephydatia muelleri]